MKIRTIEEQIAFDNKVAIWLRLVAVAIFLACVFAIVNAL